MNIKLGNVISDILGKSGQDIISAIVNGERNPSVLAELADPRCKSPRETIRKSLEANWDEDLVFMLKQSYELYLYYQKQMQDCDKQVHKIAIEYIAQVDANKEELEFVAALKKKQKRIV